MAWQARKKSREKPENFVVLGSFSGLRREELRVFEIFFRGGFFVDDKKYAHIMAMPLCQELPLEFDVAIPLPRVVAMLKSLRKQFFSSWEKTSGGNRWISFNF